MWLYCDICVGIVIHSRIKLVFILWFLNSILINKVFFFFFEKILVIFDEYINWVIWGRLEKFKISVG